MYNDRNLITLFVIAVVLPIMLATSGCAMNATHQSILDMQDRLAEGQKMRAELRGAAQRVLGECREIYPTPTSPASEDICLAPFIASMNEIAGSANESLARLRADVSEINRLRDEFVKKHKAQQKWIREMFAIGGEVLDMYVQLEQAGAFDSPAPSAPPISGGMMGDFPSMSPPAPSAGGAGLCANLDQSHPNIAHHRHLCRNIQITRDRRKAFKKGIEDFNDGNFDRRDPQDEVWKNPTRESYR